MHCWEEMFQGDSSSIVLSVWMGCGDNYRNEETTCSFKVYDSCQGKYLLEKKSMWKGVVSGKDLGEQVIEECCRQCWSG